MIEKFMMPIIWDQMTASRLVPLMTSCQRYCAISRISNALQPDARSYRSDALAHFAQSVFPQSCHTPCSTNMAEAFTKFLSIRDSVVENEERLSGIQVNLVDPLSLLLVNWQLSLFDGACSPETHDYIDNDCMPGWDTWLAIVSLGRKENDWALLCWVPPELCREVDSAIEIDAADCMSWLAFDIETNRPRVLGWGKRWPN